MLEPIAPPLPFRAFNALGRTAHRIGLAPLPFDPEQLKRRAVRDTGLDDFGEPEHAEALEVLCRSLEEEAHLNLVGRVAIRRLVLRNLATRLRRVAARTRTPDVFAAPLNRPLIVMGLPRSGTTFLHRLLCLSEDARPLRMWELQRPIRSKGPDRRRQLSARDLRTVKAIAPKLDAKHYMTPDEPEECMGLLDDSFMSATYWIMTPTYGYQDWYLKQDHTLAYRGYREHLQLFQAETPERRLTLKAPIHTGHLDALLTAVPEALVVQTHRDLKPVVGSVNSLFHTIQSVMSEHVDPARMGRANLDMLVYLMEHHLAERPRWEDRIIDVRYDDLIGDPVATTRRIHERFDLGWDDALDTRLRDHLANRPQHKFGRHTYSLEECGLTAAEVDGSLAPYRERFLA